MKYFALISFQLVSMKRFLSQGLLVTSLLTPFVLTSFSPSLAQRAPKPSKPSLVMPQTLANTTWRLASSDVLAVPEEPEITLSFSSLGMSGSSGCNRYRATVQGKGNQLKFGAIATTRMACPPPQMEIETAYLQALGRVQSYRLTPQGDLELRLMEQGQTRNLRFTPVQTTAKGLQQETATTSSLDGTEWQLSQLGNAKPLPERPATLAFKGDRLSGTGGCNRFVGGFTGEGFRLTVSPNLASTMMACPAPLMKQEQQIIEALKTVTRYSLNAQGQLLLFSGQDETNPALVFDPASTGRRVGTEKILYVNAKLVPCSGVAPMQCLQVRENPQDNWRLHYGAIEGFTFEPGYLYELKIREETIANPPADGSSKKWTLVEILRKTPWGPR